MTTYTFPPDFLFGAATAAFQIEGGAPDDGRGRSIWDEFCDQPGRILDGSNGQVACDHYHRMPEDVALMRELNLNAYRFSTSWARVSPDGRGFNPKGVDFYSRLVDELLAAEITPWLTLYHWDLPQALQDQGGWENRDTAYRFAEYTSHLVEALGDRVGIWTTLNEAWCSSFLSYAAGVHAPGHVNPREAVDAAHHLLLAHGLGVQALRAAPRDLTVGITVNTSYAHPADPNNPADVKAASRIDAGFMGVFLDPIFKGEYPAEALEAMAEAGLGKAVRDGDMALISAPIDVLGVNFYNGAAHRAPEPGAVPEVTVAEGGYPNASPMVGNETIQPVPRNLPVTSMGWEVNANDLRLMLERVHRTYTGPAGIPIVVTENGAAYQDQPDAAGFVDDSTDRLAYIRDHLVAVHQAMNNGVAVRGYLVWSLLDNFEWTMGYTERFGIVRVDYETLRRIPKTSALWYAEVARTHQVTV
ncbi:MAG: GH1 family beta-glucosidase [Propionibacteriaceae bacterium]|nr:GH1 family beta-glucosidase [Propionibacteriaceae bacterium]